MPLPTTDPRMKHPQTERIEMTKGLVQAHAKVDQFHDWADKWATAFEGVQRDVPRARTVKVPIEFFTAVLRGLADMTEVAEGLLPPVKVEKLTFTEDKDGNIVGATKYSEN
jgi:hypothetical protein